MFVRVEKREGRSTGTLGLTHFGAVVVGRTGTREARTKPEKKGQGKGNSSCCLEGTKPKRSQNIKSKRGGPPGEVARGSGYRLGRPVKRRGLWSKGGVIKKGREEGHLGGWGAERGGARLYRTGSWDKGAGKKKRRIQGGQPTGRKCSHRSVKGKKKSEQNGGIPPEGESFSPPEQTGASAGKQWKDWSKGDHNGGTAGRGRFR